MAQSSNTHLAFEITQQDFVMLFVISSTFVFLIQRCSAFSEALLEMAQTNCFCKLLYFLHDFSIINTDIH